MKPERPRKTENRKQAQAIEEAIELIDEYEQLIWRTRKEG